MLAGEIMNRGKITEKLDSVCNASDWTPARQSWPFQYCGEYVFGGITGSARASTSCMGGILIPAMKEEDTPQKRQLEFCCGFYLRANYPAEYHHGCICHPRLGVQLEQCLWEA